MLADANPDGGAGLRHAVPGNIKLGDVAPTIGWGWQQPQEREVLHAADASPGLCCGPARRRTRRFGRAVTSASSVCVRHRSKVRRTSPRSTRRNLARRLRASACSSKPARWWMGSRACLGSFRPECLLPDGWPGWHYWGRRGVEREELECWGVGVLGRWSGRVRSRVPGVCGGNVPPPPPVPSIGLALAILKARGGLFAVR